MLRVALALQRMILRTERGPLRPLWRLAYAVLGRGYAAWLRGTDRRAAVYLRGGRTPVYGLSDVDPAVLVDADPGQPGLARERVLRRRERLRRWAPRLCDTLLDSPYVLEGDDLAASAPAPLYGLDRPSGDPASPAVYFGERSHPDGIRLCEHPGIYGLTSDWRLMAGSERRPTEPGRDAQERRVAAWLELQAMWRWFLQSCRDPAGPRWADLCVKSVAEPARIWLWLCHGERTDGRRGTLERALALMPEEEGALRAALALERSLGSGSGAPHAEFAGHFVRLTSRVADLMAAQVADAGETPVRLVWGGQHELTLPPNAAFRLAPVLGDASGSHLLPLADWRSLTRASLGRRGLPMPALPDETLAPLPLDPARLSHLAAAVGAGDGGPYPALRGGSVLVLASVRWPRTQLRAVASPLTDPASFALLDGRDVGGYPNVAGWSADHTARRAVAEHAAWLEAPGERWDTGHSLAMVVTAARAALFLETVGAGTPELGLTVAATLRLLRERLDGATAAIDDAEEAYRRFRLEDRPPPAATVAALRGVVVALPAYRLPDSSPRAGLRSGGAGTQGS